MNFKEAYQKMLEGKKVKRKGWKCNPNYWFIENDTIKMCCFGESVVNSSFNEYSIKDTLAEDWEVVEEKKKYWRPKKDERYYFIDEYQEGIGNDTNDGTDVDDIRLSIGNCFKTKEEAEHMVEKLKVIHELQKFAYENNEGEIYWNDVDQSKYMLIYDIQNKEIDTMISYWKNFNPFNIYFTSYSLALTAIETIGKDRIKKYYFDVEE